jgi:hypothetical protein
VLASESAERRTIRSPHPDTGNSPRAQRGPKTCHQRSSPSRPCDACTIAIVPAPVNVHTHPHLLDTNTPCDPLNTPCSSPCARTNAQSHHHCTGACAKAQSQERWRPRGPRLSRPGVKAAQATRTSVRSSLGRSITRAHECARRAVGFACVGGEFSLFKQSR